MVKLDSTKILIPELSLDPVFRAKSMKGKIEFIQDEIQRLGPIDLPKALQYAHEGLEIAKELGNSAMLSQSYLSVGVTYGRKGDLNRAMHYLQNALEYLDPYDNELKYKVYYTLGTTYGKRSEFESALEYLFLALEYTEEGEGMPILHNIATVFLICKKFEKALFHFEEILKSAEKNENSQLICSCLTNIGKCYLGKGKPDLALEMFEKALAHNSQKGKTPLLESTILKNIGTTYKKINEFDLAEEYLKKSLKISKNQQFEQILSTTYFDLADLFLCKKDYSTSINYLSEAENLYAKLNDRSGEIKCLQLKIKCLEVLNDKDGVILLLKKLLKLKEINQSNSQNRKIEQVIEAKEYRIDNLKEQKRLLDVKNKELVQYTRVLAHDLKEPLRIISGFTDLLLTETKSNYSENSEEYAQFIKSGISQMNNKLSSLVKYSSLSVGSSESKSLQKTNSVLKNVLSRPELIKLKLKNKVEIEIRKLPNLIINDKHLFELFYQLISNALKFSNTESSFIIISSCPLAEAGFHTICIEDSGIGIDEEYHKKIFNIFDRLNRYDDYVGEGIGLAICKKIVSLYCGKISVKSSLNNGSKFYFSIPKK